MQFGGQEFNDGEKVLDFAKGKGFVGTVMSVGDVVGPDARESWKLFYEKTGAAEVRKGWASGALKETHRATPNNTERR